MESFYEKLAKSGWLGTKAQVSQQYGNPIWKDDSMGEALKRAKQKVSSSGKAEEPSDG